MAKFSEICPTDLENGTAIRIGAGDEPICSHPIMLVGWTLFGR